MATSEANRTRAPRGAKAVVSAFMTALDDIPDARRVEVAKAAQTALRDEVKMLAVRAKEAARKPAGRKPAAKKPVAAKTPKAKKAVRKMPAVAARKASAEVVPIRRAKRAMTPAAAA